MELPQLLELASAEGDQRVLEDIKEETAQLSKEIAELSFRLKMSGEHDRLNAILTIHAGAGGTEACDWTEMLVRMYRMWAESRKYKVEVTDLLAGEEAGLKRITFLVRGHYAYGYLKAEIGVHRLVRISPFDSNQRRHTSFAACDVLPEFEEELEIEIQEKDLRVDTYRASGHGGQHVNKTDSAVRITHLPTGIVAQCQNDRSQHKNRATAMKMLKARLYELELDKKREERERRYTEKGDIGWGNQIRSYVFQPYTMVKDHRTNFQVGNIEAVMNGALDPFIEAYLEKGIGSG